MRRETMQIGRPDRADSGHAAYMCMVDDAVKYAKDDAAQEGLPFRLSIKDVEYVVAKEIAEHIHILDDGADQFRRLVFGAVIACNRLIAEDGVPNVEEALVMLVEARLSTDAAMALIR